MSCCSASQHNLPTTAPRSSVESHSSATLMASFLRAHHKVAEGLALQSRRQIHVEPGVREKALLAKDPALERFKSYRKSASGIRRVGDYLTIAVVAGCCYEIYVRAVTREEARKTLKSN